MHYETPAPSLGRNGSRAPSVLGAKDLIRVVVVDDHPLTLRGMAEVLGSEPGMTVVGQAETAEAALALLHELTPEVAVLDLHMPGQGGLAILEALRKAGSETRPVLLADELTEQEFVEAVSLGVRGVVLKSMPAELLVRCVRIVHGGGDFLEKNIILKAFTRMLHKKQAQDTVADLLTRRERTIAKLAASGMQTTAIAEKLGISEGTVKSHLHRIYDKLGVDGRIGLMRFIQEMSPG